MLIDWFTVMAQAVNFVILIFLLKRFLYGPILRAMEAREMRVASAMQQAKEAERAARQRAAELASEKQILADSKHLLLNEAREEVQRWRRDALDEVKREVEALRRSWELRLDQDREDFLLKLKAQVAGQVIRISDKVLRDLADETVENRLITVLVVKLAQEDAVLQPGEIHGEIALQSGFPLAPAQSELLRRHLAQIFPGAARVSFETSPDLGLGLRLVAGDRKVEWNLAHYLRELETGVMAELFSSTLEKR